MEEEKAAAVTEEAVTAEEETEEETAEEEMAAEKEKAAVAEKEVGDLAAGVTAREEETVAAAPAVLSPTPRHPHLRNAASPCASWSMNWMRTRSS